MDNRALRILQVSTADQGGGAEKVAWHLFESLQKRGCESWLAVGRKYSEHRDVLLLSHDLQRNPWTRFFLKMDEKLSGLIGKVRGTGRLRSMLRWVGRPYQQLMTWYGLEDFDFPASRPLLENLPSHADILQAHNLHGHYFDLRTLAWLSRQVPVILTLHDAWLLSGHCAHSFDCERWRTGCGACPDLSIYPAIRRDATARNWRRKRRIFSKSVLYVTTPCQWLMDKVKDSILQQALIESRIIPYGVDLTVFHPVDKQISRKALNLPQKAKILLFAANGIRKNIWKDYQCLREAIKQVAGAQSDTELLFVALGESAPAEQIARTQIHFIPYQNDPQKVAAYFQAADIYLHAAKADTFPNVVIEALACGTPIVATAVGGIPEQVKSLRNECQPSMTLPLYDETEATGILVPAGDAAAMAAAVLKLIRDEPLRARLSENASYDAANRFNLDRMIDAYSDWYQEILTKSR